MVKPICAAVPVYIIDLDNEREFAELISRYAQCSSPASEKIGLISELEEWIQERNANQLPVALGLPDARGCKTFAVVTAYSDEPQVALAGSIRSIEEILEIESGDNTKDNNNEGSGCAVSLRARLTAIREQASQGRKPSLSYADVQIDRETLTVSAEGVELRLTPAEFRLMQAFVHNPGRVFSRDQLLTVASGGGAEVSDRSIDSHIKNLRKKLLGCAKTCVRIRTVYGVGYKLE